MLQNDRTFKLLSRGLLMLLVVVILIAVIFIYAQPVKAGCVDHYDLRFYSPCGDAWNGNCTGNTYRWEDWRCYQDPCAGVGEVCYDLIAWGCIPCY